MGGDFIDQDGEQFAHCAGYLFLLFTWVVFGVERGGVFVGARVAEGDFEVLEKGEERGWREGPEGFAEIEEGGVVADAALPEAVGPEEGGGFGVDLAVGEEEGGWDCAGEEGRVAVEVFCSGGFGVGWGG